MKDDSADNTIKRLREEVRELERKLALAEETIRIAATSTTAARSAWGRPASGSRTATGSASADIPCDQPAPGQQGSGPQGPGVAQSAVSATVSGAGLVLGCTERFASLTGRSSTELIGTRLAEVVDASHRGKLEELLREGLSGPVEGELVLEQSSGSTFPVVLSVAPVRDAQGSNGTGAHANGDVLRISDITEQRRPALIHADEALHRSIFEHMADAVIVCDTSGQIIRASRAARALCGSNPLLRQFQEALTLSWLRGPLDRPAVTLDSALRGVTIRGWEVSLERADGKNFALLMSAGPLIGDGGEILGAVITLTDITALRYAEIELKRKADDLQETDRRKNEFLAMLAHELRNPLTPIRSSLEIMNIKGIEDPDIRRCRDVISRQTQQFTFLIDDLLEVSRINTGKIQIRSQSVDLVQSIHTAAEAARPVIEAKRHTLNVECADEPIWISADPARLTQVLGNLISNASKYTDPGGTITLSAHRDKLEAVIRIKDTGQGIPPEMLPKVFDLFTQVDRTLNRSQGGLGIGLALVRKLVMMHGGLVEAASEGLGRGSEFTVRLPTAGAPPLPHAPPEDQLQGSKRPSRRVLVVDDDNDSSQSLATLLRMLGHEVRTASDGQAALAAADQFHPDVVLCDIGLPVLDGYEVARQLRSRSTDRNPPRLIALTGYGREEDVRRSRDAGFHLHLVKPFDRDMLDAVLNH